MSPVNASTIVKVLNMAVSLYNWVQVQESDNGWDARITDKFMKLAFRSIERGLLQIKAAQSENDLSKKNPLLYKKYINDALIEFETARKEYDELIHEKINKNFGKQLLDVGKNLLNHSIFDTYCEKWVLNRSQRNLCAYFATRCYFLECMLRGMVNDEIQKHYEGFLPNFIFYNRIHDLDDSLHYDTNKTISNEFANWLIIREDGSNSDVYHIAIWEDENTPNTWLTDTLVTLTNRAYSGIEIPFWDYCYTEFRADKSRNVIKSAELDAKDGMGKQVYIPSEDDGCRGLHNKYSLDIPNISAFIN